MNSRGFWASGLAMLLAPVALGQIENFHFTLIPGAPEGFVTTDISITGTGQWTGVQVRLETEQGSIFQHELGGTQAPNAALLEMVPDLAYDTFVAADGNRSDSTVVPIVPGGAVNLGGSAAATFDTSAIDITWAPAGGYAVMDPDDFFVARVTLSETASGTADLLASAFQYGDRTLPYDIVDGQFVPSDRAPYFEPKLPPIIDEPVIDPDPVSIDEPVVEPEPPVVAQPPLELTPIDDPISIDEALSQLSQPIQLGQERVSVGPVNAFVGSLQQPATNNFAGSIGGDCDGFAVDVNRVVITDVSVWLDFNRLTPLPDVQLAEYESLVIANTAVGQGLQEALHLALADLLAPAAAGLGSAAVVPEPTALWLSVVSAAVLLAGRQRGRW